MELSMWIVFLVFVFIIVFCGFLLIRNGWVYKIQMAHTDNAYALIRKKIGERLYDSKLSLMYYDCVWNSNKMLWHFWIWDLRKMVSDRERFDELHRTPESDDLEAIRKKVIPNTHVANLASNGEKE